MNFYSSESKSSVITYVSGEDAKRCLAREMTLKRKVALRVVK